MEKYRRTWLYVSVNGAPHYAPATRQVNLHLSYVNWIFVSCIHLPLWDNFLYLIFIFCGQVLKCQVLPEIPSKLALGSRGYGWCNEFLQTCSFVRTWWWIYYFLWCFYNCSSYTPMILLWQSEAEARNFIFITLSWIISDFLAICLVMRSGFAKFRWLGSFNS